MYDGKKFSILLGSNVAQSGVQISLGISLESKTALLRKWLENREDSSKDTGETSIESGKTTLTGSFYDSLTPVPNLRTMVPY